MVFHRAFQRLPESARAAFERESLYDASLLADFIDEDELNTDLGGAALAHFAEGTCGPIDADLLRWSDLTIQLQALPQLPPSLRWRASSASLTLAIPRFVSILQDLRRALLFKEARGTRAHSGQGVDASEAPPHRP